MRVRLAILHALNSAISILSMTSRSGRRRPRASGRGATRLHGVQKPLGPAIAPQHAHLAAPQGRVRPDHDRTGAAAGFGDAGELGLDRDDVLCRHLDGNLGLGAQLGQKIAQHAHGHGGRILLERIVRDGTAQLRADRHGLGLQLRAACGKRRRKAGKGRGQPRLEGCRLTRPFVLQPGGDLRCRPGRCRRAEAGELGLGEEERRLGCRACLLDHRGAGELGQLRPAQVAGLLAARTRGAGRVSRASPRPLPASPGRALPPARPQ